VAVLQECVTLSSARTNLLWRQLQKQLLIAVSSTRSTTNLVRTRAAILALKSSSRAGRMTRSTTDTRRLPLPCFVKPAADGSKLCQACPAESKPIASSMSEPGKAGRFCLRRNCRSGKSSAWSSARNWRASRKRTSSDVAAPRGRRPRFALFKETPRNFHGHGIRS
jgi:hypothetical protein